ncbi:MAG: ABC transporter ATP-binding protein [Chloroflexi bacterium]|nr:ABC transporter ATP-binding protein [Chloroflexota bacterium]
MICLESVTKRYGDTLAVDGLSFEVNKGEVCVLIGPSGCGKTTTLRMINRLVEPTSGRILIDGRDTSNVNPVELRQSIGYAIQSVGLFPHMTVGANIAVVPQLQHWPKDLIRARVNELLAMVGLDASEYISKYPAELSGGEAQRIGVARALAADPPILLMDEPFGAVDPLTRERLQTQFLRIQQTLRKTVILVTHDLDEAIRLADRIAIMNAGKLVQYDTPETILARPANRFVHDFVGTDRALKRLARVDISRFIRPSPTIRLDAPMEEVTAVCDGCKTAWVVDERQRLVGWIDRDNLSSASSIREAMVAADAGDISVNPAASLREALSRMLGQGFRNLPVVDEDGRLLGELTLDDIAAATTEGEK